MRSSYWGTCQRTDVVYLAQWARQSPSNVAKRPKASMGDGIWACPGSPSEERGKALQAEGTVCAKALREVGAADFWAMQTFWFFRNIPGELQNKKAEWESKGCTRTWWARSRSLVFNLQLVPQTQSYPDYQFRITGNRSLWTKNETVMLWTTTTVQTSWAN